MGDTERMSEFIDRAEGLLNKMEESNRMSRETHKLHEIQLVVYRDMVNESINLAERRWNSLRQVLVAIGLIIITSGTTGVVSLNDRPTKEDVANEYSTKDDVARSIGVVVDDVYDEFEGIDVFTHEESEEEASKVKIKMARELGFTSRSPKEIK